MRLFLCQISVVFIFLCCFVCCENDNGKDDCSCPDNTKNLISARQLSFTISINYRDLGFVSIEKIDSIKIKVDGILFKSISSETIDTTGETRQIFNNIPYVPSRKEYLAILPNKIDTAKTQIIADYIGLLETSPVLSPGDHVIEISEIQFKNLINQLVVFKPQVYKGFTVAENSTVLFIGEFGLTYNE